MTIAHDHTGYDQDYEEAAPTLMLLCPACQDEMPFYGDGDEGLTLTLPEFSLVWCNCGAHFHEGDVLLVIQVEKGVCPWCNSASHPRACAELRARLMGDEPINTDDLITSLDAARGALEMLIFA